MSNGILEEGLIAMIMYSHVLTVADCRYVVCDLEASPSSSKSVLDKLQQNRDTIRVSLMKTF